MTRISTGLFELVGPALVRGAAASPGDGTDVAITPELAADLWQRWSCQADDAQRRAEVEALARLRPAELERALAPLLAEVAPDNPDRYQAVASYLQHIPGAIRRRLRRPADPDGVTAPAGWAPRQPDDLLALLPRQLPWFTPGDRPGDLGDWELLELTDIDGFGETWQARNPHAPAPVLLKFCLHPGARERLLHPETLAAGSVLDQMLQVEHPGLLQLRRLHRNAHPPCLEYEIFAGSTLTGLVENGRPPDHEAVLTVVKQLAETLGFLHRLEPPLVHRGLRPGSVLVRRSESGALSCKLLDLGLSTFLPGSAADSGRGRARAVPAANDDIPLLYASPQELRGEPPQPRDDIYALGILWYQLLTGNFAAGRPGGSQWRRRLTEQGAPTALIELLESCFEDDPFYRPADAADLAEKLRRLFAPPEKPSARKRAALDDFLGESAAVTAADEAPAEERTGEVRPAGRVRARRSEVWQLFDTLEKKAPELPKVVTNSLGLKLVLIPAGTFSMGTPAHEAGARANESPRHEVTLTRPFYLAATPVTQQQYAKVMGHNPARFHADNGGGPDHPAENVTWEQAVEFCRRLTETPEEKQAGRIYRLPTEAEWEYACRAGGDAPFCFGAALSSAQANFDGHFPYGGADAGQFLERTSRVGQFPPNNFGLHDVHGNVWEWCADWLGATYYEWSPRRDPAGPGDGRYRVLRGGSWKNHAVTCRAGYRNGLNPRLKDSATGFRVVCEMPGAPK